jgi:hypothetical protein
VDGNGVENRRPEEGWRDKEIASMFRMKSSASVLGVVALCGVSLALLVASNVQAEGKQKPTRAQAARPAAPAELGESSRVVDVDTNVDRVPTLSAAITPVGPAESGDLRGGVCPTEVRTHSAANFTGGAFTVQAGMVEDEIAAASFVIPSGHFPITIRTMEIIWAQNHFNQTVTQWSVLVYEGTPSDANQIEEFFSDDVILPHLRLPLNGSNGANVQVTVDPQDAEQIIISSAPSNTVSIGFKIVQHNNQTGNGCSVSPDPASNAFPTTDNTSPPAGLAQPTQNWLRLFNCGNFCGSGWSTLGALPCPIPGVLCCRPGGDWNIRLTYEPSGCVGACCLDDGNCAVASPTDCVSTGGTFQGSGTTCSGSLCQGGCCYADTIGQQCQTTSPNNCASLGGEFAGVGTSCGTIICEGACCVPFFAQGEECVDPISQFDCEDFGGIYMSLGSTCAEVEPCFPTGGCCTGTSCTIKREMDCDAMGGVWYGAGTTCTSPPTAACCFASSGTCSNLSAQNCCTFGGLYQGAGTNCTTFVCFPEGACCMPDGSCQNDVADDDCANMGGAFQGNNVLCSSVNCPQPTGACCASSGGCAELDEATCNGIPGAVWQGPLTTCSPDPCTTIGACCASGGGCVELDQATCEGIPGAVFAGPGTTCPGACGPQTGACCNADGTCTPAMLQADCEDCHGTYLGDGSTCAGSNCDVVCRADTVPQGGDGQVTISDVTNILTAYGLPCVDCAQDVVPVCGDNAVTIADVNFVITAFGPCP